MKFVKNMLILSLMGLSLVSLTGGVGPRAAGAGTRAAARGVRQVRPQLAKPVQPKPGLSGATQILVGGAGATAATLAATGAFSEKQDIPEPGYEQGQEQATNVANMTAAASLAEQGLDAQIGSDAQMSEAQALSGQAGQEQDEEEEEEDIQRPAGAPYMGGGFGSSGSSGGAYAGREKSPEEQAQEQAAHFLVEAIKKHDGATVQKLIELGVPVNQKDQRGSLPLTVATVLGLTDIVSILLDAGARVDMMERNVIESADWGLKNILQFAQNAQAELRAAINDQDKFGQTMLMRAVTQKDQKAVRKYLDWGAEVDLADRNGNTPLLRALVLGNPEVAEILFAAGADETRSNKMGDTPRQFLFSFFLKESIKTNNVLEVAEWVKKAKADGLDLDRFVMGFTPLINAVQRGTPAMVQIMLAAGVDVNKDINGLTPIRIAVESNKVETAKLLLAAGANANEADSNGATLLMVASAQGSVDMVQALLDAGARTDLKTKAGFTAYQIAISIALDLPQSQSSNYMVIGEMLEPEMYERLQQEQAGEQSK